MGQLVHIGEVVEGRYKIVRPIADGGMGTVFLAEHWLIKRKVAIKILHADLAEDAVMVRRFMNEALAAGTLGHPHIVESTDMGFTKHDVPYIVFEYLEGVSLADEIVNLQKLPLDRSLAIANQIASALEAAHRANIVHRDLKSDNIFLTKKRDGTDHVKVLDFGISRFLSASDKTARGGNLLGTPEFMAPEQVTSPEQVDHRVDIYALGVLIWEMVTGRVPFVLAKQGDIEAAHELLARVVSEPPPPLGIADAPEGLERFVATLLAKQASDRFQSMAEVQHALAPLLGNAHQPPIRASTPRIVAREIAEISDKTLTGSQLTGEQVKREVAQLGKRWSLVDHDLVLDLHDREFTKLAAVVTQAALIADETELQPRIAIEYPHLRIVLPDTESVVELVFAARVEQWLRDNGW
ncbi:MAG TPA: serine/threonine-protein kinase [Kofleriaceae bacterium]